MAIVEVVMPKMGESIMEATILKWHKQPGETVKQDETILDIATDKVDTEVPSPVAGILRELLFSVNDVVPVGAVIARVNTSADAGADAVAPRNPDSGSQKNQPDNIPETAHISSNGILNVPQPVATVSYPAHQEVVHEARNAGAFAWDGPDLSDDPAGKVKTVEAGYLAAGRTTTASNGSPNRFYSPLVLNIAGNEGIALQELESIPGTGNEGRVTKKDILQFIDRRKSGGTMVNGNGRFQSATQPENFNTARTTPGAASANAAADGPGSGIVEKTGTEDPVYSGSVEIVEMDRMRRLIADHMVRSKQTSPHVTSFSEADVTNLVQWREKEKAAFEKREGTKLTLTPIFIQAIVRCIKKFPMINSSLQGTRILIKKDLNIGMATALPTGNLIVPVIKNADSYNLVGLARQVNQLAGLARENKLKPADIQDGTFTLTNLGLFGSLMGVPIINQPQSAILAVGAIKKRPVVIETESGDTIGIRQMMYLSMSYDHRIIDGALGASFLTAVAKELEAFAP